MSSEHAHLMTGTPCQVAGYHVETLDEDVVLFNPSYRTICHSNATGALIWQLCDGQRTVADIIALLQAAYPDAAPQIPKDVQDILQTFSRHGAITWVTPPQ